ncbi:MAG: MBL fold metallo-hydrolase [Candidatus Hadarchaeales archaeon]
MVKLKWWGQACFEIRNKKTVVIDPHDGTGIGLPSPKIIADIVLISHGHYDHADGLPLVSSKSTTIVDKAGKRDIQGVKVEAIESFHDSAGGKLRGKNLIFLCEIDRLTICHLGDLGHVPTEAQLKKMKNVDVLLLPVGGVYTIDASEATLTMEKVNPKITIPMHYKIPGLNIDIAGVEPFLKGKNNVKKIGKAEVDILKSKLPSTPEIWVLKAG